jgi:drug/metabolite transporter (DMT)-like permease
MPRLAETALLTLLALVAFASNSILTRMALGSGLMDAATFTTARLAAGALVLGLLVRLRSGSLSWSPPRGRTLVGAMALAIYAAPFSFAYVRIGAAAGALLLFGAVQITMIGWGIFSGERPRPRTWAGIALSVGGLAWLTLPSVAGRPDPIGSALMVVAGCAWGVYSLAGKGATDVLEANARSFVWALPAAMFLNVIVSSSARATGRGLLIALIAGGITSGLGYAIWYRALRGLTATTAAVLQLSVPVIAAGGAVALLDETVSPRLVVAAIAVIGGVSLVLSQRARRAPATAPVDPHAATAAFDPRDSAR